MRPLTQLEATVARAVVDLGSSRDWEFAAYLATPAGPLIELVTRMRDDAADPSQDVLGQAGNGTVVVHHNHLTQESLSSADWRGMMGVFAEVFAHCADGTTYWGRVTDAQSVSEVLASYQGHEMTAATMLSCLLQNEAQAVEIATFFAKDVINRAMKVRMFVEYEVTWGGGSAMPYARPGEPTPFAPVGKLGTVFSGQLLTAAQALAPSL